MCLRQKFERGDGRQKWQEYDFRQKLPVNSVHTLWVLRRFRDKCVFAFYTEIQEGRQKWQENDFHEKSPVDSADTMQVKNFVEIALSCTVIEIYTFYAEIQDGRQNGGKMIFGKSRQ